MERIFKLCKCGCWKSDHGRRTMRCLYCEDCNQFEWNASARCTRGHPDRKILNLLHPKSEELPTAGTRMIPTACPNCHTASAFYSDKDPSLRPHMCTSCWKEVEIFA